MREERRTNMHSHDVFTVSPISLRSNELESKKCASHSNEKLRSSNCSISTNRLVQLPADAPVHPSKYRNRIRRQFQKLMPMKSGTEQKTSRAKWRPWQRRVVENLCLSIANRNYRNEMQLANCVFSIAATSAAEMIPFFLSFLFWFASMQWHDTRSNEWMDKVENMCILRDPCMSIARTHAHTPIDFTFV